MFKSNKSYQVDKKMIKKLMRPRQNLKESFNFNYFPIQSTKTHLSRKQLFMFLKAKKYLKMNLTDKTKVQSLQAGENQQMVYKIYLEMLRNISKDKNQMKKKSRQ